MCAFDPMKDEELYVNEIELGDGWAIEVKLARYDGGEPKIGITRFHVDGGGRRYRQLGRMTTDTLRKVMPALQQALDEAEVHCPRKVYRRIHGVPLGSFRRS